MKIFFHECSAQCGCCEIRGQTSYSPVSKTVSHIDPLVCNVKCLTAVGEDFGDVGDGREVVVMKTKGNQVLADDHVTFYQVSTLINSFLYGGTNTKLDIWKQTKTFSSAE